MMCTCIIYVYRRARGTLSHFASRPRSFKVDVRSAVKFAIKRAVFISLFLYVLRRALKHLSVIENSVQLYKMVFLVLYKLV